MSDPFSSFGEQQMSIRTPSGRVVTVGESALGAIVTLIEDARQKVFDELLELLDRDYARTKECGDETTAAALEVIRAKVRAKREM